jgi:NAD+ diphosphatase
MIPFSGNPLDRASVKRTDAEWVAAQRRHAGSMILPMWRLQPFIFGSEKAPAPVELGLLRPGLCETLAAPDAPSIFLGLEGDTAMFALDISAARNPTEEGPLAGLGHFRDARAAAATLPMKDAAIMGQAKAMIDWHNRHGFCPNCGAKSELADAGWKRYCANCKTEHFPRTDPVVIMLATAGEHCLLGRSPRFASTMWSCLAGFIEPGEAIEDAVRRETREESGITCGRVTYFHSQPWPFPTTLMIGCHAEALTREIVVDREELEDARWFSRDEVATMLIRRHPGGLSTPPPVAIAHHLIRAWFENETGFD